MNKWTAWYDSLPEHTRRYLDSRPVWHDRDLFAVATAALAIGVLLGLAL